MQSKRQLLWEIMESDETTNGDLETELSDIAKIHKLTSTSSSIKSRIKRFLKKNNSFTILDIGCGSADIVIDIAKWARKKGIKAEIKAIDINHVTVKLAKKNARKFPEIKIEQKDILKEKLPENNYDFIIMIFTLHHFSHKDGQKLIKKLYSASKHMLLIDDLINDKPAYIFTNIAQIMLSPFISKQTRKDGITSLLRSYSIKDMKKLCRESGITKFSIKRRLLYRYILEAIK